jgi:S1-C subfamily serine protease
MSLFLISCGEHKTVDIVDDVKSGVVLITNQIDATSGGTGTGFVLEDNMIITNNHVIAGNGTLTVLSPKTSKKYPAKVVYADPVSDIAVVRLLDWEAFEDQEQPVNLELGNSNETNQGDKVIVIGHPWGLTWSVSEGIISGKGRRPGGNPQYVDQVDAHLFQGNSGGPIFNEDGEVVCVSNIMLSGEGGSYGFCIPSNLVKKVLHDFNTFKEVRWRVANATIKPADSGIGVAIEAVDPGGAADKSGIKAGDIIVGLYSSNNDHIPLDVVLPEDLLNSLSTLNGDEETIMLLVKRGDEEQLIDLKTNYKLSKDYPN